MKIIAVLTGDIRASKNIANRPRLGQILKQSFKAIDKNPDRPTAKFEIFRGDSFQGVLPEPGKALLAALLIRARLRQWDTPTNKKNLRPRTTNMLPDARIGIGLGTVSYKSKKIIESDGEAFRYSGSLLDEMKRSEASLAIKTPWPEINNELAISTKLADAIISKWSSATAEAVFLYLSRDNTQTTLSRKLKISQPAVHKRLTSGNVDAIISYLKRFETIIDQKVNRS